MGLLELQVGSSAADHFGDENVPQPRGAEPVTHPPFDRSTADPGTPSPGWVPGDATAVSRGPVPAAPRRSRRGIVVAALVAGLLVLGGSGFAFASYLAGGGTQPED